MSRSLTKGSKKVVTVDLYEEKYWEVHDPQNAKLIAHFFDGDLAEEYVNWINERRSAED